jgi:NAD(P)-dependent dehydrogenase (short-subunit alcohol dehydrogenase family)
VGAALIHRHLKFIQSWSATIPANPGAAAKGAGGSGEGFSPGPMNSRISNRLHVRSALLRQYGGPKMPNLTGRNVAVLGATGGVGTVLVRRLAAEGAHVLAVARNRSRLDALARDVAGVDVLELDATSEDAPAHVFRTLPLDILIVCGGATPPTGPIHELSWTQFAANWETDVKMAFLSCRAALTKPLAPGSVVILISAGSALGGSPISGGFAGAKRTQMFIASYSQKESDRLGLGIRFMALAPSMIMPNTDLGKLAIEQYSKYLGIPEADFARSIKSPQTPQDVSAAILDLALRPHDHQGSVFTVSKDGIAKVS